MLSFLKNIFGGKSERDIREIMPIVNKIHAAYEIIKSLSNDDLRAKTTEFKEKISMAVADENAKL